MGREDYKRPESVLVVVYTSVGEFLLMERTRPHGFWQSVTGSLRWDETPLQAARRELWEETGLRASARDLVDLEQCVRFPIKPLWRPRYGPDVRSNLERWFAFELPNRRMVELSPHEHRQYRWLSHNLARNRTSSSTNREALDLVYALSARTK